MEEESKFSLWSNNFKRYIARLAVFAVLRCIIVCSVAAWILSGEFFHPLVGMIISIRLPFEMIFTGAGIYCFLEAIVFVNMFQDARQISDDEKDDEISLRKFIELIHDAIFGENSQH